MEGSHDPIPNHTKQYAELSIEEIIGNLNQKSCKI